MILYLQTKLFSGCRPRQNISRSLKSLRINRFVTSQRFYNVASGVEKKKKKNCPSIPSHLPIPKPLVVIRSRLVKRVIHVIHVHVMSHQCSHILVSYLCVMECVTVQRRNATHATVRCVRKRKRNDSAGGQRSTSGIRRLLFIK